MAFHVARPGAGHNGRVPSNIELVYDRLVAAEKLSSDKKYERLAAIVFRMLDERGAVHDMRLRGTSRVLHQIDVVVGELPHQRRALIECKDYTKRSAFRSFETFGAL